MAGPAPPLSIASKKQAAEEIASVSPQSADSIRQGRWKTKLYELLKKQPVTLPPQSPRMISSAEALRLARLRFQAGVTPSGRWWTASAISPPPNSVTPLGSRDYNRRLAELPAPHRPSGPSLRPLQATGPLPSVKPQATPYHPDPDRTLPCQIALPGGFDPVIRSPALALDKVTAAFALADESREASRPRALEVPAP